MNCLRCERPLPRTLRTILTDLTVPVGAHPFCRAEDLAGCLNAAAALVDPPLVWVDPSNEDPPEDLLVCSECKGSGQVFTSPYRDYETGARPVADCPRCLTTGKEPLPSGVCS